MNVIRDYEGKRYDSWSRHYWLRRPDGKKVNMGTNSATVDDIYEITCRAWAASPVQNLLTILSGARSLAEFRGDWDHESSVDYEMRSRWEPQDDIERRVLEGQLAGKQSYWLTGRYD